MPKVQYREQKFRGSSLAMIDRANAIIEEYEAQGYTLTLRQLYYQLVARDVIPNKQTEYNRLSGILNDARLAGLVDWDALEDRTRNLRSLSHWREPAGVIRSAAASYHLDYWADQPAYVEVWVEKDALVGVLQRTCSRLDVPYFSCRGYTSASEMWRAGQRLIAAIDRGKEAVVIHLGDHDPSGIDMSRDIEDRLVEFIGHETDASQFTMRRVALTMRQINDLNPPPNPAKATDARFASYQERYGDESWELDALPPTFIDALITETVESYMDHDAMARVRARETRDLASLEKLSDNWQAVSGFLGGLR